MDMMDEMLQEDMSVNNERYNERFENKCLPRIYEKPIMGSG